MKKKACLFVWRLVDALRRYFDMLCKACLCRLHAVEYGSANLSETQIDDTSAY
jgi:hypothetical protein